MHYLVFPWVVLYKIWAPPMGSPTPQERKPMPGGVPLCLFNQPVCLIYCLRWDARESWEDLSGQRGSFNAANWGLELLQSCEHFIGQALNVEVLIDEKNFALVHLGVPEWMVSDLPHNYAWPCTILSNEKSSTLHMNIYMNIYIYIYMYIYCIYILIFTCLIFHMFLISSSQLSPLLSDLPPMLFVWNMQP
jgi:hypothetical protein